MRFYSLSPYNYSNYETCSAPWKRLTRITNVIYHAYYSLNTLDFSACLRVANTIQNGPFCADLADYIIKNEKLSAGDFSLVTRMGDNLMDKILQSVPLTEDQKLLLLIEWFETRSENVVSTAEGIVGWLFEHIDCTNIDSKLIISVLGKPASRFANSERCR